MIDGAAQETTSAARGIKHRFAKLRINTVDDELSDGAGGVELAGIASTLKVLEDLFVDAPKRVAVLGVVEVDLADLVDHLPHQRPRLHVVVGVFKNVSDHLCPLASWAIERELVFEGGKQLKVDEITK